MNRPALAHGRLALALLIPLTGLLASDAAQAARLEVSPDASLAAHLGAAILLWAHIGGGALGLVAGLVATLTKKGSTIHRLAGKAFLITMGLSFLIGAGVAPFLHAGQQTNLVAGVLALYLLLSGIAAARRRAFRAGWQEIAGLVLSLTIVTVGVLFMRMAAASETGTVDGGPAEAFVMFAFFGSLTALGEANALLRRTLDQAQRMRRHLWRICFAFFIASSSLFLGQPQVFPAWFSESWWPVVFANYPIVLAGGYLIWSWITTRSRQPTPGVA